MKGRVVEGDNAELRIEHDAVKFFRANAPN